MMYIDVSYHQGKIDWNAVKAAGVKGVMIRAGYGNIPSQKDKRFEENYTGAKNAGLEVGVYWYSYAKSKDDVLNEMKAFCDVIAGKQFELPVAYDMEYEDGILEMTKQYRTEVAKAALDYIESRGYYAILYCSADFIRNYLNAQDLASYDLWVAAWGNKPSTPIPFGIWQHSNKGNVSGISGVVDLDTLYKDYASIIKNAGLNGFSKPTEMPPESVWDTNGPFTIKAATGNDKARLKALCDELKLEVI